MSYEEVKLTVSDPDVTAVVTNDVTIFNWTATDTTLTPTRVDTNTAGSATGTITFNGTDATAAANIQTAIRALGGIYADATCTAGVTADNMIITVYGGYDITWSKTGGTGTITESGAAGSDTATPGKVTYTGYIPVRGTYAEVKRIHLKGFVDNSLDVTITDNYQNSPSGAVTAATIFSATGLDTYGSNADAPYLKLLTADGVAGEDGAAAANASGGVFNAPFKVVVATSSPITVARGTGAKKQGGAIKPVVALVIKNSFNKQGKAYLRRSTGAMATGVSSTVVNLGEHIVKIKRIRLAASADTSIAPTVTDADGLVAYTKTSTDYTTPVNAQLVHEGVDQANNAVADLLDVVVKSPVTVAVSGGVTSGTFNVEFICEV